MSDEKKVAIQILEPATSCYECGGSVEDIDPDHWVWVTEEEYRTLRAYFDDPFGHGRAWGETDLGVLISHGTKEDTETKIESILEIATAACEKRAVKAKKEAALDVKRKAKAKVAKDKREQKKLENLAKKLGKTLS